MYFSILITISFVKCRNDNFLSAHVLNLDVGFFSFCTGLKKFCCYFLNLLLDVSVPENLRSLHIVDYILDLSPQKFDVSFCDENLVTSGIG